MIESKHENRTEAEKNSPSENVKPRTSFWGSVKTMASVSWQIYKSSWFWTILMFACTISGCAWVAIHMELGGEPETPGQIADQIVLINFIIIPLLAVLIVRNMRRGVVKRTAKALLSDLKSVRVWALAFSLSIAMFLIMYGLAHMLTVSDHHAVKILVSVVALVLITNLLGIIIYLAAPQGQLSSIGFLGALKPRVGLIFLSVVITLIWVVLTIIAVEAFSGSHFKDGAIIVLIAGLMMVPIVSLAAAYFLGTDQRGWVLSYEAVEADKDAANGSRPTALMRRIPRPAWIGAGAVSALAAAFYTGSILNTLQSASEPGKRMSDERMATEVEAIRAYEQRVAAEKRIKTARALFKAEQYREAYDMALGLANAGHAEAQFLMFELGWNPADHERSDPGDAKDVFGERKAAAMKKVLELTKEDSIEWLRKAAKQGHVEANRQLGYQYYHGSSVLPKDYGQAVKYTRIAAEQDDSRAQNNLGYFYGKGVGVAKNNTLAFKWFKKAADNGHADAARATGYNYRYGLGVSENEKRAYNYYLKAAKKGDAESQMQVGWYLMDGRIVARDYQSSFTWTAQAAAQRNPAAITNLAYLYENGFGVRQDKRKAFSLYMTASSLNDATGAYNAAMLIWDDYKFGPRGNKPIRSLLKKAHELGHKDAARKLAEYNRGAKLVSGIMSWGARVGAAYFSGDAKELDKIADEQFRFLDQLVAPKKKE